MSVLAQTLGSRPFETYYTLNDTYLLQLATTPQFKHENLSWLTLLLLLLLLLLSSSSSECVARYSVRCAGIKAVPEGHHIVAQWEIHLNIN
jgi:hypothetical protein